MKKLIVVAASVALFACSEAEAPEEVAEEPEVAAADVPDGGPVAGSYAVVEEGNPNMTWTNNEDGTYSAAMEGVEGEATGSWTMGGREFCYDPDAEGEGEVCLAFSDASEDGSWVSTRPDGTTATIKRIEETAEAEAAE